MKAPFKMDRSFNIDRVVEIANNTASTAEWLADFVSTTVKAESRHFAQCAVRTATEKLTGYREPKSDRIRRRDVSLDPLAGVSVSGGPVMDDLLAR